MAAKSRPKKKTLPRAKAGDPADAILDTALDLAEATGWAPLRLSDLARNLDLPLTEVLVHYRDKDAIADAWFGRALAAMLAAPPKGFEDLPPPERLQVLLLRWFDALAPHRAVTGQMLKEKLYPSHPHHWVPMMFNLSRTVQWWRDAARLEARGRRRQLEEVGLTALFLATLRVWLNDESENQTRTRDSLRRRLGRAGRALARLCPRKAPAADDAEAA